ncbi:MAG TPA: fumarylacetoacetate hydrolase family protein [Steroidobacteraceae bacterium]|nr:fumarylacetoacetate hydrolase family protein [Steroidobacteraceae bacterium]
MLTEEECRRCAEELLRAARERVPIAPPSRTYRELEVADAYRIQDFLAREHVAQGARAVGYKIGFTSHVLRKAAGALEPAYGRIFGEALHPDGAQLQAQRFLKPRVELELAFVMGADLEGPEAHLYDVMRATELVLPALEIIDSRTELPRTVCDTIADNTAFAAMVVGGRTVRPTEVDVRWVGATLGRNGVIEDSGVSAVVMGHPAAGIAWLVNQLHALGGRLRQGDIVLSGTFIRPLEVQAGDVIHADYGPLGGLSVAFV